MAKMNISRAVFQPLVAEVPQKEPIGEGADWMHARARALPLQTEKLRLKAAFRKF
jgi:hypothetical protein